MPLWIALGDIGPEGREYTVEDPAIWAEPAREFHVDYAVKKPLSASVFVLPHQEGCLVRGRLQGEVALACDRCAEEALVPIDQSFDDFEPMPQEADPGEEDFSEEGESRISRVNGALMLDLGALLWEEFSLALPVKPLCSPQCKGVCPTCGTYLNTGSCACAAEGGDLRMAALRQVRINK